ncbi:FadR family transcriptional regulator [Mycolicibacterium sp. CH28]|uniref:FadR/GntR family transcriptional regulator n=1 Tax=Mycolicibacterium sp. CH28 TaxID=2512237 RepID=UPI001081EA4E|nr:FCD domain-containing protein [Mycolicibacterium sp. CH28]TGD90697.1 FadR family transcriptional regulator [Mycolicibacterium sp. CH28]
MTNVAQPTPQWNPVARVRSHELVIAAIEDQIMHGALTVGDPLPSERELAARLQVSRAGVREAIRVLEAQGVVTANVGAGPDAGTFIAAMPSAALTRFLRLHVALSNFPMVDIVDARVMLERNSAALAAAHASAAELDAIRIPLLQMDTPGLDCEVFNDADTAFHVAIAEASGNRLVADMTVAIRASLRHPILAAMRQVPDWTTLSQTLQAQHHGIFDAIESRDAQRAADLTEQHIRAAFVALPTLQER